MKKPTIYIIAGPNGAGKSTAAKKFLPEFVNVKEFVNADEIARGLSPFNAEGVAIQAGKIMLSRLDELAKKKESFAFETTLASKHFVSFLIKRKNEGYKVRLFYLWLPSPNFAYKRVQFRVKAGGHSIPKETVERRYHKGLENLFELYMPIVTSWDIINNSGNKPMPIALSGKKNAIVEDHLIWEVLKRKYG